jgi:hypothetical protein
MTYVNTKRKIQTSLKRGNEFAVVSIPKLFLDNWSQLLEGRNVTHVVIEYDSSDDSIRMYPMLNINKGENKWNI